MTYTPRLILGMTLALMSTVRAENLHFGPIQAAKNQLLDEIALVVNDEAITRRQLALELKHEQALLAPNVPVSDKTVRQQLTERIIINHLLKQIEQNAQITVSDDDLNFAVAQVARQNGLSENGLYQQVKRTTGLNREQYRNQVRQSLILDKIKEGMVGGDIQISDSQINDRIAQMAQQKGSSMSVQDLLIPVPEGDPLQRADAVQAQIIRVSQALAENKDDLAAVAAVLPDARLNNLGQINLAQIPPRFARALVKLDSGAITDSPIVDQDGMHFLKVLNKHNPGEGYSVNEANVAHILLRTGNGRDAKAQKARIEAIYQELKAGADFAELARRYSEDPSSAAKGGELGWVGAEQVVGEFADAMQHQPFGQVSKPIATPYGYHIILVHDRRQTDKSENLLRQKIRRTLYNQAVEDAWQQRLQALRQEAYVDIR